MEPNSSVAALADPTTVADELSDLDLAAELTRRAGELARVMRGHGVSRTPKTNVADVVTEADHAAEVFIVDVLARLRPEDGVVGEEGAARESRSGRTWVIDPVDGTYNFVSGAAYWCSALALRDEVGVLLGSVHQPVTGEAWAGGPGMGATLNGRPLPVLEDGHLGEVCLLTYLHVDKLDEPSLLDPWLDVLRRTATVRMLGSGSSDLASVAGGRYGLWLQRSVPEWDLWPGAALVLAVGGLVEPVDVAGERWWVAGRRSAVTEAVECLRGLRQEDPL